VDFNNSGLPKVFDVDPVDGIGGTTGAIFLVKLGEITLLYEVDEKVGTSRETTPGVSEETCSISARSDETGFSRGNTTCSVFNAKGATLDEVDSMESREETSSDAGRVMASVFAPGWATLADVGREVPRDTTPTEVGGMALSMVEPERETTVLRRVQ
jgi:hypothetical protein